MIVVIMEMGDKSFFGFFFFLFIFFLSSRLSESIYQVKSMSCWNVAEVEWGDHEGVLKGCRVR